MAADFAAARQAADLFRQKYVTGKPFDRFPLDVVFIADNILKLDIVDFPSLEEDIDSSAYITANLRELYVDEELMSAYISPHVPPWKKDRLRFSVAHELGHIVMHAQQVPKIRCKDIKDLKTIFNSPEAWHNEVEAEANEFAGRLIAPLEILEKAYQAFGATQSEFKWRDSGELRDRFCASFGTRVGLHPDGVGVRLTREKLWPVEWIVGG